MMDAYTFISSDGQMLESIQVSLEEFSDFTFSVEISLIEDLAEKEDRKVLLDIYDIRKNEDFIYVSFKSVKLSEISKIRIFSENESMEKSLEDIRVHIKTVDLFSRKSFISTDGTEIFYDLYLPEGKSNVPLMVWEHGGGEVLDKSALRTNLTANRGAVTWIEAGFETAVLSVQYPSNYSFGISEIPEEFLMMKKFSKAKIELINLLIKEGLVDQKRIYISGASSGGGAVLLMTMWYPEVFAAALSLCAKDTIVPISKKYDLAYQFGDPALLDISEESYKETYQKMETVLHDVDLSKVPIWFIQAEHDQICTRYTSLMMFDILKEKGDTNKRLTFYSDDEMENAGHHLSFHGCWTIALDDMNVLNWVYSKKK